MKKVLCALLAIGLGTMALSANAKIVKVTGVGFAGVEAIEYFLPTTKGQYVFFYSMSDTSRKILEAAEKKKSCINIQKANDIYETKVTAVKCPANLK